MGSWPTAIETSSLPLLPLPPFPFSSFICCLIIVCNCRFVGCWPITRIPSYATFVFPFCVIISRAYTPAGTLANEKAFVDCGEVEGTRSITWSDAVLTFASITLTELSVTNTCS